MNKPTKRRTLIKRLRRRLFLLVPLLLVLAAVKSAGAASPEWTGGTASGFAGGAGTAENPYRIATGEQLAFFSQTVGAGAAYQNQYIVLTQDITLNAMNAGGGFASGSPREFARIGTGAARSFKGVFDGAGFKIIGLYINQSGTSYEGLFGYAESGSVIRNVTLSGTVNGGTSTGSVAGFTNGLIENCASSCTGTVTWQGQHGGIAGTAGAGSAIKNCVVSADVMGADYTGGIVGRTGGTVSGCSYTGAVSNGWSNYHGGIAGGADAGSLISSCAVAGSVAGSESVGGIAGYTAGEISGCRSNTAAVTGQSKTGGVAGYASGTGSLIDDCAFSGTAAGTGGYNIGGIAGQLEGTVTHCAVTATVTGTNSYIGGVAGYAAGTGSKITDCTVTVTVNETQGGGYAGGVAGMTEGEISSCVVAVTVTAPNSYIGGVAGYAAGAASKIVHCTISGVVRAAAGEGYVGGAAGKADGTVTECTVSATVSGVHHYVGGVVGYAATGSTVSKSSSSGAVSGNSEVGGIAGYSDGVVTICINTGDVTGNNGHTGGVAGMTGGSAAVSNSYNAGAINGGTGQGGIGGIIGYVDAGTVVHNNLNNGRVSGNQGVGSVTGNALNSNNAWNNYYYDYANAPAGTTSGDVARQDGAVPVGNLTWEEICALLNTNNGEGGDIWAPDAGDNGVPKPETSTPPVQISAAAVKAGKVFSAAAVGGDTSAAVTSDSVFSVRWSVRYNANCALALQTAGLYADDGAAVLPAGTSVIMETDGVYYYENLTDGAAGLTLGDFVRMGSQAERYPDMQVSPGTQKDYLFIFDFTKTAGLNPGIYKIRLADQNRNSSGGAPSVAVSGKSAYTLAVSGGVNMLTAEFSAAPAAGYDYKTDGASFVYMLALKKDDAPCPWPVGIRLNGVAATSDLPYLFAGAAPGRMSFALDASGCADPPDSGRYDVVISVYACTDPASPRAGYLVAGSSAAVTLAPPADFGIRAEAGTRVYSASPEAIAVPVTIRTLGPGAVKSTLQYKYGTAYANVPGQTELPVAATDDRAVLSIPAGGAPGTYRFVLALYDGAGVKRAETVENIIVKQAGG
ncbi:The GLUG motif-containing protein [Sporobacter termitidis DSM 10068]|uniref:The GLUG motif-containing protein n=1 Tax=Sporobacter termitidis DSM 10068 TaxID=1123282 RepID=A0A1M5Y599_9FIRM|nr:GLUG motif-containing protein [Sporobacter termitidis]SHI06988.1 The GLUG motif-containing protein [Sporobacter termitidis DSM 10068]